MTDVLIRDVPEPILDALKRRSEQHRRSLQQELLTILEDAVAGVPSQSAADLAALIRERLAATRMTFSDSAELVREDRRR